MTTRWRASLGRAVRRPTWSSAAFSRRLSTERLTAIVGKGDSGQQLGQGLSGNRERPRASPGIRDSFVRVTVTAECLPYRWLDVGVRVEDKIHRALTPSSWPGGLA